jgi:hypothetical protein
MHEPEHLDLATIGAVGNAIEAPGVDPPLWSSAAMKPSLLEICAVILSLAMIVILV